MQNQDQGARDESNRWNVSRSSLCDDWFFICELFCQHLGHELAWPNSARKAELKSREPLFHGCLGFIDRTLIRIQIPSDLETSLERCFYTGRKKMYAYQNTIVVDHDGLIIYLDPGYPGSYHDVTILRQSELYQNWRQYFEHDDDSFEYVMGDRKHISTHFFVRTLNSPQQDTLAVICSS